jgi:hypothetical protein
VRHDSSAGGGVELLFAAALPTETVEVRGEGVDGMWDACRRGNPGNPSSWAWITLIHQPGPAAAKSDSRSPTFHSRW